MERDKRFRLCFILFLLITSIISTTAIFYQQTKKIQNRTKADVLEAIDQKLQNTFAEINNFPTTAADDILFLSKLADWQELLKNKTDSNIDKIEKDFLSFLVKSNAYYQVSYIDKTGKGIIMAESDGDNTKVTNISDENNKKNEEYFSLLKNLHEGDVYIFPMEKENQPKRKSFLKYATPLFNKETDSFGGIILIKVDADYFLNNIRGSLRDGEITYLIDSKGFYLANPENNKEFGGAVFFDDYPDMSRDILNCNNTRKETENNIFTYRCIDPTVSNFNIYKGSKTIDGARKGEYQWLLVTVTNKNEAYGYFHKEKNEFLWVFFIQLMINSLIFGLIILDEKRKDK